MIPQFLLREWQNNKAPWTSTFMVEQDLIITRALVNLYQQPVIKKTLVFRGGTALNKIYIQPPARYSEDRVPRGTKEFADEIKFHNQIN